MKRALISLLLLGMTTNFCQAKQLKKSYPLVYSEEQIGEEFSKAYDNNDFEAMELWLSLGADVNGMLCNMCDTSEVLTTPLIDSIEGKNSKMVQFLLTVKNIEVSDSAILSAIDTQNVEIITLLLAHDINSTYQGNDPFSPLSYAYHQLCAEERQIVSQAMYMGNLGVSAFEGVERIKKIIQLLMKRRMKDLKNAQERLECLDRTIDDMVALYRKNLTKTFHEILAEDINQQSVPLDTAIDVIATNTLVGTTKGSKSHSLWGKILRMFEIF